VGINTYSHFFGGQEQSFKDIKRLSRNFGYASPQKPGHFIALKLKYSRVYTGVSGKLGEVRWQNAQGGTDGIFGEPVALAQLPEQQTVGIRGYPAPAKSATTSLEKRLSKMS
jgi:hypothetical protein